MWGNETPHRAALFNYAMRKADPDDVILWLDADMVPAKDPSKFFDVEGVEAWAFPLYDLWGKSHDSGLLYRADDYWDAHNNHRVWALRRPEEFDSTTIRWDGRGIHSGHIPSSWWDGLTRPPMIMPKDMALLHYGYFDDDDRSDRHKRYLSVKNQLTTHELAHAQTIIDPTPNLRTLQFTPDMTLNKP